MRQALMSVDRAREIDPNWHTVIFDLARIHHKLGDLHSVRNTLRDLPFMNVDRSEARSPLHRVWYPAPGSFQLRHDIVESFAIDTELSAYADWANAIFGWFLRDRSAERVLGNWSEEHPDEKSTFAALAFRMLDTDRPEEALIFIDKILQAQPQNGLFWGLQGRALAMNGQFELAYASFESALDYRPNDFVVMLWWAEVLSLNGEKEQAFEVLEKIVELDPKAISAKQEMLAMMRARR